MEFIGRVRELASLESLFQIDSASLVVLMGRRRIGKSRLIAEFAKSHRFLRFSGIAPTSATSAQSERDHFAGQLGEQTHLPVVKGQDWKALFTLLAQVIPDENTVVLLDEISWMGSKDPDFLGLLKDAWDHHFSRCNKLVMVLCGSVSAWIEREIVNSTAFLGRLALQIRLPALGLDELGSLWHGHSFQHLSAYDKLKILSVTGGVPRYLELLNTHETADHNIRRLCFSPTGPLLDEYNRIFSDVFGQRSVLYKKIIDAILQGPKQQSDILLTLDREKSGTVSQYLDDLIEAGFVSRDYAWSLVTGKPSRKSQYRIQDNFIRFNVKFMENNRDNIKAGFMEQEPLDHLPGWYTTLGLQFENLVINNIRVVLAVLGIAQSEVVNFGPYFQAATASQSGCQIDLLIQTKSQTLFLCEIKFSKQPVSSEVVGQVQAKVAVLKRPKGLSCLPVLVHVNGVSDAVLASEYFYRIVDFADMV